MPINLENEKLIQKFLYGEMPEEERFEFEERFITDANLFQRIKVSEDELIEKYVRGWMNPAERSEFEQNFPTTAKRRERIEFSRQLFNKIEEQKQKSVLVKKNERITAEESVWDKLTGLFLTPKTAMAAAFAVLVVVFGSWILYQNLGTLKTEVVKNQNSDISETPQRTFSPTPEISPENIKPESENNAENPNIESVETPAENTNELIKETPKPDKTDEVIKQTPVLKKTPTPQTAPNPVLALFAGTLRSGGKNNVLKLPENAKGAVLLLNLESIDYKIYRAELTDADGNLLFQKDGLKANKSKINLFIPADKLTKGDYLLKLYGKNDSGENESAADFQFRVNR